MAFTSTDLSKPATPYVYRPFPRYVTHATEPARVVADDAAWQALGPGWGRPEDPAPSTQPAPETAIAEPTYAIADEKQAEKPRRKFKG